MRLPGIALAFVVVLAAGCGSSSKAADSPTTVAGGGATSGSCPFSGSTDAQTTPAGPVASVVLESVAPRRAGCIDQVQFNFRPAVAGSDVSYRGTTLVVRLEGATLGSTFHVGETVPPDGLAYVKTIKVTDAPNGEVDWSFTLDKVRPFLVSSAEAPYYIQVAIG